MRFRLLDLETWPDSEAQEIALAAHSWIDGPFFANAAKKVAELGGRGRCEIEDQEGSRSVWRLHAVTIHYVYPVDP